MSEKIRYPRRESIRWKRLGKSLDVVYLRSDDAISKGFCKTNAKEIDRAMDDIIAAANEAKRLLRKERNHE